MASEPNLRAVAEEKCRVTMAALEEEAKRRGLEVTRTGERRIRAGGVAVEASSDFPRPVPGAIGNYNGKMHVTVYGVDCQFPQRGQVIPTKSFPEGKQGVNIGKVLDRVQEVAAVMAEQKQKESAKASAAQEVAERQAMTERKAAALDRLEAALVLSAHVITHDAIHGYSTGQAECDGYIERTLSAPSLLALAESLPAPPDAQAPDAGREE